jgi:TRAP-type C4-dicarboxylate transport system permease small subunit
MAKFIYDLSRLLAWLGAVLLTALAIISVASIVGRGFSFAGLGPVPGDFELVEAGTALVVFCFLPWCYLKRGHAYVDMLWHWYPRPLQRALEAFADLLMLAVWTLLVWRMSIAMLEYRANGEVSFILQMPVWWGYAFSFLPAVFSLVVYLWRLLETLRLVTPHEAAPARTAGGHA